MHRDASHIRMHRHLHYASWHQCVHPIPLVLLPKATRCNSIIRMRQSRPCLRFKNVFACQPPRLPPMLPGCATQEPLRVHISSNTRPGGSPGKQIHGTHSDTTGLRLLVVNGRPSGCSDWPPPLLVDGSLQEDITIESQIIIIYASLTMLRS